MVLTLSSLLALAAWLGVLLAPSQAHRIRERLETSGRFVDLGAVTVLIPARNEAAVIGRTLAALARQGPNLEVVVVDDESTDGTDRVLAELGPRLAEPEGDGFPVRLRVIAGRPREPGWSGKLWALEQGLAAVERERVLLLDADIELAPGTLAALLECARRTGADLASIMATLRSATFVERLLVPAFVFFFKLLYPFALANSPSHRTAAAAGGCMLVTRAALLGLGGFAPLRGALIDDCTLARELKRRGHRIWIGMSRSVVSSRSYTFAEFWRMVSRTAFTQLRYSVWLLLATTLVMTIVLVAPVAAVVLAPTGGAAAAGAAALGAMCLAYRHVVRFYRMPAVWTLTLPVAGVLFLGMTWDSAINYWRGVRARWKDRAYGVME